VLVHYLAVAGCISCRDVSGLNVGDSVTLKFHTWDKGDSIYDTAALIDNVKLE
jgi:hypothetical protein